MSRPRRLRVRYLLEGSALFGGTKVALRHAELLAGRGHRVSVVGREPRPEWHRSAESEDDGTGGGAFEYLARPDLDLAGLPPADVTVATYWTTIGPAAAAPGAALHLCQGYEASYSHNRADHAAIRAAYARPLPAMVVSPHLGELLAREYGRPWRAVPPPLERAFRPAFRRGPRRPPRVLVVSPFEIDWKGVATALEAVALLRSRGLGCRLLRLSQWPEPAEERELLAADEFHAGLPPAAVPELVRSCDLLLAPSWEQEGFGLPALEAMASGVPVVASDVSCYRAWAAGAARLVPPDRPEAFAEAAETLLTEPAEWRRLRRAGLERARGHREPVTAAAVEAALEWVLAERAAVSATA